MGILAKAKDKVLEQMALKYLNSNLLEPYGKATCLQIDSAEKSIRLEVELKGESVPVHVEVDDYEILKEDEHYFATFKEVRTSREWLTTLARTHFCKERIELPDQVGRLLFVAL